MKILYIILMGLALPVMMLVVVYFLGILLCHLVDRADKRKRK
jgi:hypothetical protein